METPKAHMPINSQISLNAWLNRLVKLCWSAFIVKVLAFEISRWCVKDKS